MPPCDGPGVSLCGHGHGIPWSGRKTIWVIPKPHGVPISDSKMQRRPPAHDSARYAPRLPIPSAHVSLLDYFRPPSPTSKPRTKHKLAAPSAHALAAVDQTPPLSISWREALYAGITFADENGNLAEPCCWQFHFKFSLGDDMFAQDSIDLLTTAGVPHPSRPAPRGVGPPMVVRTNHHTGSTHSTQAAAARTHKCRRTILGGHVPPPGS